MKMSLLHTPEGVRDIYNVECAKKHTLEKRLRALLRLYGYEEIQTPTIEFFDIFNTERGTVKSTEMFKFTDRDGHTLVLRPDITPSIARAVAKYYGEEDIPMRFSYTGNTFKNNSSYQGRMREITQLGAEFIGNDGVAADAEVIALAIELLKASGLQDFQVDIGHVSFFKSLVRQAGFDDETEEKLRVLIENKNYFGIEDLVDTMDIEDNLKQILSRLPQWFGSVDIINEARAMTDNPEAIAALDRLSAVYELLGTYGLQKYVTIDLGMLTEYNYYTGIIFKGYTYGTGDAVVNGGRYDSLIGQFGKDAASVGFAVVIDQLMMALSRQKIEIPLKAVTTMILYPQNMIKEAIALSKQMHASKQCTSMVCMEEGKSIIDYREYCKRHQILKIWHLVDEAQAEYIDVISGEVNKCLLSELFKTSEEAL